MLWAAWWLAGVALAHCWDDDSEYAGAAAHDRDDVDFDDYYDEEDIVSSSAVTHEDHTRVRRYGEPPSVARTLSQDEIREVRGVLNDLMSGRNIEGLTLTMSGIATNGLKVILERATKGLPVTGPTRSSLASISTDRSIPSKPKTISMTRLTQNYPPTVYEDRNEYLIPTNARKGEAEEMPTSSYDDATSKPKWNLFEDGEEDEKVSILQGDPETTDPDAGVILVKPSLRGQSSRPYPPPKPTTPPPAYPYPPPTPTTPPPAYPYPPPKPTTPPPSTPTSTMAMTSTMTMTSTITTTSNMTTTSKMTSTSKMTTTSYDDNTITSTVMRVHTTTPTPTRSRRTRKKTTTTTTPKEVIDIDTLVEIIANLTLDYDLMNITDLFNMTLLKYKVPKCVPRTDPTTSTVTTETPLPAYDLTNASVISKCFVCGLATPGIPRNAYCADAFAGDFLPLVPVDPRAKGQIAQYRKYCRYLDAPGVLQNASQPRSVFGRWTGGCSVRWIDLSGVYTQRACRNRRRAHMGKHFLSKRMAKLEMALKNEDNGCVISPMASLVPLSRGISLYARFHACVCTGNWCNTAPEHAWHASVVAFAIAFAGALMLPWT